MVTLDIPLRLDHRPQPMKIAFVTFQSFGSLLTPLREYCRILGERGCKVSIFARGIPEQTSSCSNVTLCHICGDRLNSRITHVLFLCKVISLLRKDRYDIVHVFNSPGISALPLFSRNSCRQWILDVRTGSIEGGIKAAVYDKVCALEARIFDRTILLSKGLKQKLFGATTRNDLEIVPLGANLRMFRPPLQNQTLRPNLSIGPDDIVLVYTGRIDKTRRLETMLRAFQIVQAAKAETTIKLLIIGGGPDRIRQLKEVAEALGINNDVIFLAQIPYTAVPQYLAASDIALAYIPKNAAYDCQPPLKAFEYLAASLPVVATNTSANEEVIKDGLNGIITTDRPEDFASGILRLITDLPLRAKVKEHSLESIMEYDWEKIVDRLTTIYKTEKVR